MSETDVLVEQQPPHVVLERGHAGLVINKLSLFDQYGFVEFDQCWFAEGVPDTAVEIGVLHFDAYSIREVYIERVLY